MAPSSVSEKMRGDARGDLGSTLSPLRGARESHGPCTDRTGRFRFCRNDSSEVRSHPRKEKRSDSDLNRSESKRTRSRHACSNTEAPRIVLFDHANSDSMK